MTPTATPARIRVSPPSRHSATPAQIRPVTPAVRAMRLWLKVSVATAIMSAPVAIAARSDGLAWLLAVAGTVAAFTALRGDGQGAGGGQVEGVEVDVGEAAVEAEGLVGHGQGQRDGDFGGDDTELAGGHGDAGLAAAVDGMDRRRLGRG